MARNGVEDGLFADVGAGECPGDLAGSHPPELELAVELHGHLLRNRRIDGRAERIVDRRKARGAGAVEDGEVLAVRIAVADEKIEDHAVDERQHVRARETHVPQELRALDDRRASLVLVLDLGTAPEQLAEILLMKPPDDAVNRLAVIAPRHVIVDSRDPENSAFRRLEAAERREPHAEMLVVDRLREPLDPRLDDVGGRRAVERQEQSAVLQAGDELVLRPRARNAAEVITDAQRPRSKITQKRVRLGIRQFAENRLVRTLRLLAGLPKGNCAGTVASDHPQQPERILRRQLEDLGNPPANPLVRQQVREERHHVALLVNAVAKRKRRGYANRRRGSQVVRKITERHTPLRALQCADKLIAQIDVKPFHQPSSHGLRI